MGPHSASALYGKWFDGNSQQEVSQLHKVFPLELVPIVPDYVVSSFLKSTDRGDNSSSPASLSIQGGF